MAKTSAASGAAVGAENDLVDADLQRLMARWPALPDGVKARILALLDWAEN